MRGTGRFVAASFALLALRAVALADPPPPNPPREEESEAEVALSPRLDETGRPLQVVVHVVDETTLRPIAGARVHVYPEIPHPVPGPAAAPREGTTGADGFVRLERGDLPPGDAWIYADAPGYAPDAEYASGTVRVQFRLRRGVDVPLEVRDDFDLPLAGALVGYVMGCGHTPDVRSTVTDERGRCVVRSIAPSLWRAWIVHERVMSEYHELGRWRPGDPPLVVRCRAGRAVTGRVLDAEGAPVAGAAVGWISCHHGPWVRTDARGRFRLLGVEPDTGDEIVVEVDEPRVGPRMPPPAATFEAPPADVSVIVRLPPKDAEEDRDATTPPPTRPVTVVVRRESGELAEAGCLVATRIGDGTVRFSCAGDDEEPGSGEPRRVTLLDLPTGRWIVRSAAPYERERSDVLLPQNLWVTGTEPTTFRYEADAQPRVRVSFRGRPDDGEVRIATEHGAFALEGEALEGAPFPIPLEGEAALVLEPDGVHRVVPLSRHEIDPDGPPIEVVWPRTAKAALRLRSPKGEPAEAFVVRWDPRSDPEGAPTIPEYVVASATPEVEVVEGRTLGYFLRPKDPALRARHLAVSWPGPPDSVTFEPVGSVHLTVRRADGQPSNVSRILLRRGDRRFVGRPEDPTAWPCDEAPEPMLGDGTVVRVEAHDVEVPVVETLRGPGPWTITIPAASLVVRVEAEGGDALEGASVRLDGVLVADAHRQDEEGRPPAWVATLGGVAAGPHEVLVSSPGRRSKTVRFVAKDAGETEATVRLSAP